MIGASSRAAHRTAAARLAQLSGALAEAQQRIALGRRVTKASDDPVAFGRAATLQRTQASGEATLRTIETANRRLLATDTTLGQVGEIVQRARELGLKGANGTLNAADRDVLAVEVRELGAALASLAEARGPDGEPLFGGAAGNGPVYGTDATGRTTWLGRGRGPAAAVGGSVPAALAGPEAFGEDEDLRAEASLFSTLRQLSVALEEPAAEARSEAITAALDGLDGHVDRIAESRAAVGARMARLDAEAGRLERSALALSADLSQLRDLDLATAIADLQRLTTVLQAAQASFVRVSSLSLWDQLRG